ncbi:MAG: helix-turn-helix domain-containing protein [Phycisphaerae bacterium]|nr:helix-turn-helix domain-containing protein [Phycisphaerae bacterium]
MAAISASGEQSVCRGHKVQRGQLLILSPGETVHHVAAAESRSLVAMIRPGELWAAARTLLQCEPSWRLAGMVAVHPHPVAQRELNVILRAAIHRAKQESVSATAGPVADRRFEHAVLHRVVRALDSAYPMDQSEIGHTRRLQILKDAEDLMVSRMEGSLTIVDLCAAVHVSERTLHYAFRDVCGMSPMAYYKSLRLNEIRRHLQRADPRRTSISQVVERFGFLRPGNLAADYKRQFGELPSLTLRHS